MFLYVYRRTTSPNDDDDEDDLHLKLPGHAQIINK